MTGKKEKMASDSTQNLIIFKNENVTKIKKSDKFTFESIDQEDKIKLLSGFKPYGGHYILSIQLINDSFAPINEVRIKIGFPLFFKLTRSYPSTIYIPESVEEMGMLKFNIEFDELNERSSKQINLHFTPLSLGNQGEIRTIVTYVNNKDFVRVIDSDPIVIMLDNITINPKIIPSSYIKEFTQIPGMKRAIKSLGVGILGKGDPDLYFNILEQIFIRNNLQLIAKDPVKKIIWYFGTDLESRDDVLVIGQIVSNKVEIITISKNHHILILFLTLFSNEFKEQILQREFISSQEHIYDLECKYCGAILPLFPKRGEEIVCKNCNYQQIVW
ncbi:MAG: hypothetical protein ACFFFT_17065 [Candidatus Thorarchaeota archaeon]